MGFPTSLKQGQRPPQAPLRSIISKWQNRFRLACLFMHETLRGKGDESCRVCHNETRATCNLPHVHAALGRLISASLRVFVLPMHTQLPSG